MQGLDRLADELLPRVAEHLLHPMVRAEDPPVRIDDDRGVRRRLQQLAELILGSHGFVPGLPHAPDDAVDGEADEPSDGGEQNQAPVLRGQGGQAIRQVERDRRVEAQRDESHGCRHLPWHPVKRQPEDGEKREDPDAAEPVGTHVQEERVEDERVGDDRLSPVREPLPRNGEDRDGSRRRGARAPAPCSSR